jgi:excisionase family DNA binding protein
MFSARTTARYGGHDTESLMSNTDIAPLATSIDGACRTLGIGKTKLYDEISSGRLRAVKFGKKTLIPTDQFPGWLASLEPVEGKAA